MSHVKYMSVRDFIDFLQHQHHLVTWSSRSISGCGICICCFLLIVPKIWDVEMLLNFRTSQFGEDLLIDTWKFIDRSQYPNLHPLAARRMEKMGHRKRKSLQLWQQRKREKVWCVLDSFKCLASKCKHLIGFFDTKTGVVPRLTAAAAASMLTEVLTTNQQNKTALIFFRMPQQDDLPISSKLEAATGNFRERREILMVFRLLDAGAAQGSLYLMNRIAYRVVHCGYWLKAQFSTWRAAHQHLECNSNQRPWRPSRWTRAGWSSSSHTESAIR